MRGILRFGALGALGALGACGCGNVTVTPDAAVPDAPPDMAPAPSATHRWVVDKLLIPKNNPEAVEYGLDLNNDAVVDNQLGSVFAALTSQGFDLQAATDTAVARGTLLLLGEAAVGIGGTNAATFTTYLGENPQPPACSSAADPICRRHLQGTATFAVAAASARHPALAGTLANGTLLAGPGKLQVSLVFSNGVPLAIDLIGARVRLQMVAAGSIVQSVIGGAITTAERDTKIIPGMHQNLSAQVAADCAGTVPPDCGCAAGSTGKTILNLFDTMPKDCVLTVDEIRNNTLIQSLLAPDVIIDGQQALSVGFGVTAVKGVFTP